MEKIRAFSAILALSFVLLYQFQESDAKEEVVEFKVVPNKPGKIEVALDTPPIESSTCWFEWDSSGATVEVCFLFALFCL